MIDEKPDTEKDLRDYVVSRLGEDYVVLALMQNGIYEFYGSFGSSARRAKYVAETLNGHIEGV